MGFNITFGPITFLAPLALIGLIILPLIWWLLRVTPPAPKKHIFPPLRILQDVMTEEETPDSTPLWLLLFRILLAAMVAIALARPILFQPEGVTDRPLVLIIDDGWAAATNWADISKEAETRILDAQRKNLKVKLITGASDIVTDFMSAPDALRHVKTLAPYPLEANRAKTADHLAQLELSDKNIIWLSSGYDYGQNQSVAQSMNAPLTASPNATYIHPLEDRLPIVPDNIEETADGFRMRWKRVNKNSFRSETITAHARDGRVIGRSDIEFNPGSESNEVEFTLPAELKGRISLIRVEGVNSAGSVHLLDDSWGRPVIGILTDTQDTGSPLLSESYYTDNAITPYADIFSGQLEDLLPLGPSIIMMPDEARIDSNELRQFIENGGLLIRFAGPKLASRTDGLLPVRLREGGRNFGGALTWEEPQTLQSFPEGSPFFGLKIPDDIRIEQQLTSEPGIETDNRTWARLEDGSPVVTSAPYGLGRIVFFHITAGPEWSNLAVSGLYIEMLRRLFPYARSTPSQSPETNSDWTPEQVLNGYGRMITPTTDHRPLAHDAFDSTQISSLHPPGLYRQGGRRKALNTLANAERKTENHAAITGLSVNRQSYGKTEERSFTGLLLGLALFLLAVDAALAIITTGRTGYFRPLANMFNGRLNGIFKGRRAMGLAIFFTLSLFSGGLFTHLGLNHMGTAHAQSQVQTQDDVDESLLSSPALTLYLAYIKTGDARTDQRSEDALESLKNALSARTTIEPDGVNGVIPGEGSLIFYPFLYFPISHNTPSLSPEAARALNAYMAGGGTLVLDTQDEGDKDLRGGDVHPGLARVTKDLDIPSLAQPPKDHVINKAFYLIDAYPGRWAGGQVWFDKNINGAAQDGVSSVIIGSNDWAAGWAVDENGFPLATLTNDIPRQQEMSIRFGVNLAMYVLAGSYKSDQVHAATLVERLSNRDRLRRIRDLGPGSVNPGEQP